MGNTAANRAGERSFAFGSAHTACAGGATEMQFRKDLPLCLDLS